MQYTGKGSVHLVLLIENFFRLGEHVDYSTKMAYVITSNSLCSYILNVHLAK